MKDNQSLKADELLNMLAESSPNDAVKLLFLGEEDLSLLDGLDLSLISEIKRSPGGAVEMKFVDRVAVLRELLGLQKSESEQKDNGKNFYAALDRAAQQLNSKEEK